MNENMDFDRTLMRHTGRWQKPTQQDPVFIALRDDERVTMTAKELFENVRQGHVQPQTVLYDYANHQWFIACEHPTLKAIFREMRVLPQAMAPILPPPRRVPVLRPLPTHRQTRLKDVVGPLVTFLMMALLVYLAWYLCQ